MRFSLSFKVNGEQVARSYDAVLDTDGQTVAEALAANLDFAAQAAAAGLTVDVSGHDMTLALSSAEAGAPAREVAFSFEIRETATLYKQDGTGFFCS